MIVTRATVTVPVSDPAQNFFRFDFAHNCAGSLISPYARYSAGVAGPELEAQVPATPLRD
jgi:hypothetical protein